LHNLPTARNIFAQQHPAGIDAGAFHKDVLAVGNGNFLMLHELAFADESRVVGDLRRLLGEELFVVRATHAELPIECALLAYPFNSQVLTLADRSMAIVAPEDAHAEPRSRAFLERVVESGGPVRAVHYIDVRQSMQNGGGPACLRLRVPLTVQEISSLSAKVFLDDTLYAALCAWVDRHYRDRLVARDLADPALSREGMVALDELTRMLALGSVYDFQL
jgi:succinylarginine dihydrolase